MSSSSDRHLLLGLLALQCGFITKDQLVAAFSIWTSDKSRSLDAILIENKAVSDSQQSLLSALVVEHLKQHDNDLEKSLASIGSLPSIKSDLERIADSDLHASLLHVSAVPKDSSGAPNDPFATQTLLNPLSSASRFRILRPHAMGGLGQVSVALDQELHREVAFKEIKSQFADQPESRQRFVREAEITGALEHPSIVPVYGLGTYGDGRPYYAMRFIKGDSLKDWITEFHKKKAQMPSGEKTLALRQLLSRFIDVCQAMHYAHSRGVLHRDLKPHNVMLGKYGETLVVDWGLAKTLGEKSKEFRSEDTALVTPNLSGSSDFTMQGSAIGTPAYMSPEQADGKIDELGPASDIYSLGVTLYHCLTGQVPFEQASRDEVMQAVRNGRYPKPREVDRSIPRALEAICTKAMQKRASDRYATALALADDIEHFLAEEPVAAHPESITERATRFGRKHKTATQTAIIGLAALSILLAASTWIVSQQREAARKLAESNKSLANEKSKLAQDKSKLAEDLEDALKKSIEQSKALQLESAKVAFRFGVTEHAAGRLSTANREFFRAWLLSTPDTEIRKSYESVLLNRLAQGRAGEKTLLNARVFGSQPFSPDGKFLFTSSDDGYLRIFDITSSPRLVHEIPDAYLFGFSPDGARFVTQYQKPTSFGPVTQQPKEADSLQVWEAKTLKPVGEALSQQSQILSAVFEAEGKVLKVVCDDGHVRVWDLEKGAPKQEPIRIAAALALGQLSPDGATLVATTNGKNVRLINLRDLRAPPQETPLIGERIEGVTFSPDSKFVILSTNQEWGLFESASAKLIHRESAGLEAFPEFSPDSARFVTVTSKGVQLWNTETGAAVGDALKADAIYPEGQLAFSPAGDSFAFINNEELVIASTDDAGVFQRLQSKDLGWYTLAFSPDGRYLAVSSSSAKTQLISVYSGALLAETFIHEEYLDDLSFSPDGIHLLTASNSIVRLSNFHPHKLVSAELSHDAYLNEIAISSDGKLVATTSADGTARIWDAVSGMQIGQSLQHKSVVSLVCFSPDNSQIATAAIDGQVRLWDVKTSTPIGSAMQHSGSVNCMRFSPNGQYIATAAAGDKEVRLWNTKSGKPTEWTLRHEAEVDWIGFNPDGRLLATASKDMKRNMWDLATGKLAWPSILGNLSAVEIENPIGIHPDGNQVVIAANDGSILLAETRTGKQMASLSLPDQQFCQEATFSNTGKYILTSNAQEQAIWLWNANSHKLSTEAIRHPGLQHYAFAPNDRVISTCSAEGEILMWDVLTSQRVSAPLQHSKRVESFAFDPMGTYLATACDDGKARIWSTSKDPLPINLQSWLELKLGCRLSDSGEMIKLTMEEQRNRSAQLYEDKPWIEASKRFEETLAARTHWRAVEAGEHDHHWFSAVFHLKQLHKKHPNDSSITNRLKFAEKKLPHWRIDYEARQAEISGQWAVAKEKLEKLKSLAPGDETYAIQYRSVVDQERNPKRKIERPKPPSGGFF